MPTIASVRVASFNIGGTLVPHIAVYLNGYNDGNSISGQTLLNAAGGAIGSGVATRCTALSYDSADYYSGATSFNLTSQGKNLVQEIKDSPSGWARTQLGFLSLTIDSVQIIQGRTSPGYLSINPWEEVAPAMIFIDASDNYILVDSWGMDGLWFYNTNDSSPYLSYGRTYIYSFGTGTLNSNVSGISTRLGKTSINYDTLSPVFQDSPYDANGNTDTGGGGGVTYDGLVNDPIDFPTLPSISASNAGFVSIWTPTLSQMQSMARWLWTTDLTKIAFWQKLITNPLDLIFGIYILPISIHHTDDATTPTSDELVALNDRISLGWMDTGIGMDYVVEQYIEMDMGSIDVEECWGAFLDYEPYTKIDIYLPYIGVKSLDTNECMPKTVALKYMIDIATGTCIALIKCDDSVYYHFVGNCASQIPITAVQMQEVVKGVMSIAVGAASFGIGGMMGEGARASKAAIAKGAAMQAGGAAMAGSGADSIAKGPRYPHSGTMAAAAGIMDVQTPYLIFSRPKQAIPEEQQKYTGYPSFITKELSELEGYTEVQIIHLHNMSCTTDEVNEIEQLLMSGVIF